MAKHIIKSLFGERKSKKVELFASFLFTSFFSLLLLILFPQKKSFATPLPVTTFPSYLQNSVVLRLTGCLNQWLQQNFNYLFVDDGVSGSGDELCPAGQYQGTLGSFSTVSVPCGWKTLNMLNALIMDLLDKQKKIQGLTPPADDDPVMCCCDPTKDSENCTGPATPGCPSQFPNRGKCMALKPEATNYFVVNFLDTSVTPNIIRGYQAWGVTWVGAPGSTTAYWSGLLDQCLPIPLLGNLCLNLSLNDVCNATTCGPILNYNGTTHPGNCWYTRTSGGDPANNCDDDTTNGYRSANRDNWILRYNPVGGVSLNFSVGESVGVSCGMGGAPYSYNGKIFTGNEGFITIELFLNPISIDIDAATPSAGNRITFTASSPPPLATNVAPGRTDCNDSQANQQGDCYVRAYLRARGALKLKVGATLYLEHRTGSWPHLQDVGIAVREINFSEAPWISLALDWTWSEQSPNCTATSTLCVRKNITVKAMKTIEFIDVVLRGLFRFAYIPSGLQQYFGPVVFDISGLTQMKTSYFFPTWVRPITTDDLLIDIALGGDPYLGTQVLRSKSCFASNGVGPGTNRNELYLIGSAMIDLDLFRRGTDWKNTTQWYDHRITSCGYVPPPYGNHPAPSMIAGPSSFFQLPHAGSRDSLSLTSCEANGTFVGLSIFQNVFTYLVSDIATSGLMCLAISQKGEGFASGLPLPIWTVGQMKLMIPDLYNFLESEFGSNVTDMPMIFVFKPKPYAAYPGFPQTPQASFANDLPPNTVDPLPITADVLLTLPNNDFEIWVDVDNELEQWGLGPGEVGGTCTYGLTPSPVGWCTAFPTGTTPPAQGTIDVGPVGNAFRNNFPDCVSFIDCDSTVGNPSDRVRERRFIAQFNVGVTLALDLNFLGCGRGTYKVFGNLAAYGFPSTLAGGGWYNPWNPATTGNCTTVSHLRRVDLTLGMISRVGSVDVTNDSGTVKVYYPFSNNTFAGYLADFIAVILSGALALDAQLGYTLSAILDPDDNLYSATPANNNVVRIGGHARGQGADRLIHTYIARDDVGNSDSDPSGYPQQFLTIAIDFQGFIHPNFFYGVISQLLSGSTNIFGSAPRFVADGNGEVNLESLNPLVEVWQKISNGGEYFISFRDIQEFVKKIEKSGLIVPMKKNENGGIDDFPPETVVEYVQASQPKTIIKLSCVDDYTKPDNCWFGWRWKGKMWQPWIQSNTIEIRGLPDGEYEIEVRALDERAIPDITPVTVKFVVDDTPPSIFFPKKAFFKRGDVLRVELWDYITKPDEIEVSYKIDNSDWSSWQKVDFNDKGLGIKLIRLPDEVGTHKVIVRARDKKGNIETREFYFDIGVPAKGIFSCSQ
ncbi:MAG: hypothetical protein RRA63_03660 [Candidatus Calescibacterium sp.]|nr:hypothetical protein [Candidatus Calescibacterium sp.]